MPWINHIPPITPQQPTAQPPQPMTQPPQESTKGLEITGLVLSSVPILALAGVVLSIIALAKTKSLRGTPSTLSIIGVVIGIFMSILTIASIVTPGNESSWDDIIDMAKKEAYSMYERKRSNGDTRHGNPIDIKDKPTTANNDTITSPCFTFTIPTTHFLTESAKYRERCMAKIVADNGVRHDNARQELMLLSILIEPQTGDISKQKVRDAFRQIPNIRSIEDATANGNEALKVQTAYHQTFSTPAVMYYIFDTSGRYQYNGKTITSYLITAPGDGNGNAGLDSILKSFTITR